MARVLGIGGIFLKARDPKALQEWYRHQLGLELQDWGGAILPWKRPDDTEGMTVWSLFDSASTYFGRPEQQAMVNYMVDDLDELLAKLREAGCAVDEKVEESEYGRFGWVTDPEGNRLELWQMPAVPPGSGPEA